MRREAEHAREERIFATKCRCGAVTMGNHTEVRRGRWIHTRAGCNKR